MFSFFSVFGITASLISFVTIYFVHRYLIAPGLLLRHYKKQGGKIFFHKNLTSSSENFRNALEKNDYFLIYREAYNKDPKMRFLAENFGDKVLFVPIEFELVKGILNKLNVYQKAREVQGPLLDLGAGSLSFSEGESWKKQRKMTSSALNFEFLKALVPMMRDVAQGHFKDWIEKGDLENINLAYNFAMVTGDVSGRFFFGQKFSKHTLNGLPMTSAAMKVFNDCVNEQLTFLTIVFGPNLARKNLLPRHKELNNEIREFREKCKEIIKEAKENPTTEVNFLKLLLDLHKESSAPDHEVIEQIVGDFIGLFIGGTETTAGSVTTALYYLTKNPTCLQKVKEEVDREIRDINAITIDDINRMEYTTACLKETVRMGVGVGGFFFREAMEDDELCGVQIKKGTIISVFSPLFHYSEKFYSNPQEFIPERWLGDSRFAKDGYKTEPFSFLAFAAGPRNCIGQHLSIIEAKIILAVFMKTFTYKIPEECEIKWLASGTIEPVVATLKPLENSA